MSPSVKLALKEAKHILSEIYSPSTAHSVLRKAIEKAERSSAIRRKRKQPKAEKRAQHNAETAAIREAVMARARGHCECGCGQRSFTGLLEMDHQAGRGKAPQSIENCWALHPNCHHLKTLNKPSRETWLRDFLRHCQRHGYRAEEERARRDLAWVLAKKAQP